MRSEDEEEGGKSCEVGKNAALDEDENPLRDVPSVTHSVASESDLSKLVDILEGYGSDSDDEVEGVDAN